MAYDYPYIRDRVVIGGYIQSFYDSFAGDGPVYLLGRIVEHQSGFNLRVGQRPLVIVADEYHGNGGMIDARGPYPGGNGGTVIVRCKRCVDVHVNVSGGVGATGVAGADAVVGTPDIVIEGKWVTVPEDPFTGKPEHEEFIPGEIIPGTPSSPAGIGGAGGPGGNAGTLVFTSVSEGSGFLTLVADGGSGGSGGPGGLDGFQQAESGAFGIPGSPAEITHAIVSESEFLGLVRNDIGIYANYWAPFRIVVGTYFYHMYNASIPERAGYLLLAAQEFAAALQFQPDNQEALRLQRQLLGDEEPVAGTDGAVWKGGGNNALGLPREMDLLPRFDYYIQSYASFGSLVLDFMLAGAGSLLSAEGTAATKGFAALQLSEARSAIKNIEDDLEIAEAEQAYSGKERDYEQQRLDAKIAEIRAALPVMETKSFSFGDLVDTVASVGAAVIAVAGAIPSGGASLIAVVPSMIALADSVSNNGAEIAKSLLKGNKSEDFEKVKGQFDKVGKDVSKIVKGAKSIVNFVNVLQNIGAGSTPDNSRYVALVKQGAELAYAVMLAESRVSLAGQRVEAVKARLARANSMIGSIEQLLRDVEAQRQTIRQVGRGGSGNLNRVVKWTFRAMAA